MAAMKINKNGEIKTYCSICPKGCGIIIHMKEGRPSKVEGDPGETGGLCIKGLNVLEYVFHPGRLTHPLMRSGKRGEGKWDQVTWDDALNHVAERLNKLKEEYGPESVAFIRGASKSYMDAFLARLANVFGSPNLVTMGQCCHLPKVTANSITCGYFPFPDLDYPPSCIIVWGYNPKATFIQEYESVVKAVKRGAKLIVIDPKKTSLAEQADFWIKPRPGTDLALALGMIHIIINEGLHDREFVDQWTIGYEKLSSHIQQYTPGKVEEITWVPRSAMADMTRAYIESRPASILMGNALDHNLNSFQTARAITILRAISGNIGTPGGEIKWGPLPTLSRKDPEANLGNKLSGEVLARRVGVECNILPLFKPVMPDNVIKAILDEKPYPIRGAFIQAGDPLITYPKVKDVFKALNKLDFSVVIDMFMTPTAALADVVLPASSFLEYDNILEPPQNIPMALAQRKVMEFGECWSDYKINIELAKRLGLGKDFVWQNEEQALNAIMKPAGLTFEEFKQIGKLSSRKYFRHYLDGGFDTPSGKIELYSDRLEGWGYDPLPTYYEPPETPFSEPDLSEKYPFILTSFKPGSYRHSWGHQVGPLRSDNPDPLVIMNSETAERLDIKNGDWIYIETRRGRIKQKTKLMAGIDPRVIITEFGWWHPEKDILDSERWERSNINVLTDNKTPFNRAMGAANELGSPTLRGICCNVYK